MAATPAGLGAAASVGVGASAAVGDGLSLSDATYATVTEMITSGIASRPLDNSSNVASNTAVIGSRSMVAVIAPMPMAAPEIMSSPGTWERATPPTAPRNIAGKIGPPRRLLNARHYPRPLPLISKTSAPTEYSAALSRTGPSADCPESAIRRWRSSVARC